MEQVPAPSTTQPTVLEEDTNGLIEEKETEAEKEDEQDPDSEDWAVFKADGVEFQINLKERLERERKDTGAEQDAEKADDDDDDDVERYFIGELGP